MDYSVKQYNIYVIYEYCNIFISALVICNIYITRAETSFMFKNTNFTDFKFKNTVLIDFYKNHRHFFIKIKTAQIILFLVSHLALV